MAIAVNNPVRQDSGSSSQGKGQEKESDLDKILKALTIANQSFGIAADIDKIRTGSIQRESLTAQNEEQKLKNTALADQVKREKEGIYTKKEADELISRGIYVPGKQGEQGSFGLKVQQGDQVADQFYKLKPQSASPLDELRKNTLLLQQNKLKNELAKTSKDQSLNGSFNNLSKVTQEQIKDISKTNAKVLSVKNGIDAAIAQLENPKMSDDLKLKAGENLLKLLNSAEGSDAVGAEESKRLGSLLEYKIANFTGPGSFVGRDIDMFTEQVKNKSDELGQRIVNNENTINDLTQGKSIGQIAQSPRNQGQVKQGSGIINEAIASPNQPAQIVIQGNNKFKFNPKTNQYEFLEKVK